MEAVDFIIAAGLTASGILVGIGFAILSAPFGMRTPAKVCFLLAASIFGGAGLLWGAGAMSDWKIRWLVLGIIGAVSLVGAAEGLRIASPPAEAANPSPTPPSQKTMATTFNGPVTAGQAGSIQNNGPVYNGPVSQHHETKIIHVNSDEGILTPAHDPDPILPPAFYHIPAEQRPSNDTLKIMLGNNLAWSSKLPHVVLRMGGEDMIVLDRNEKTDSITVSLLRIFDDRNDIIARIDQDGFWVKNGTFNKRPDKHTLIIHDHNDEEVFKIKLINKNYISITGVFRNPKSKQIITITPEHMSFLNGIEFIKNVMGENGVDINTN